MGALVDIWNYRGFIFGSVKREFQQKYRNSLLGAAWAIVNPLAMIIVYTVIFSRVMQTQLPGDERAFGYSIYLCAGILTWGLFVEIVGCSQTIFLENANLLKKVSFPRICLPVVVVLKALLNFAIIFGLFTIFLILSGNFPGLSYLAVIPLLILEILFSISLGIIVGVLNIFFRDIGQAMGILIQFWFWLTPIVYFRSILSETTQRFIAFNPLADLVMAFQGILVLGQYPDWKSLFPLLILSVVLCVIAMRLFRRRAGEMVDEL